MNRDGYLQALRDNLTTKTDDEKDDIIRKHLEELMNSSDEQAQMEQWGRPEALADQICGTNNYKGSPVYERDYYSDGYNLNGNKSVGTSGQVVDLCGAAVMYLASTGTFVGGVATDVVGVIFGVAGTIACIGKPSDMLFALGTGLLLHGVGKLLHTVGRVMWGKAGVLMSRYLKTRDN